MKRATKKSQAEREAEVAELQARLADPDDPYVAGDIEHMTGGKDRG